MNGDSLGLRIFNLTLNGTERAIYIRLTILSSAEICCFSLAEIKEKKQIGCSG